jgi:hypothetical protein
MSNSSRLRRANAGKAGAHAIKGPTLPDVDSTTGCADDALPGSGAEWGDALDKLTGKTARIEKAAPERLPPSPHHKCRFPLWGDNDKPTQKFCDAPTQIGRSWCKDHQARCFTSVQSSGWLANAHKPPAGA